jgi:hypothetical protein
VDDRGAAALAIFAVLTIVTLLVLFGTSRSRSPVATRLIGLGVFTAVIALWYGLLTGLPTRDHGAMPFGANPALAETALRLGAIMVLGGVVITLLTRETVPPLPTTSEARNVPPSL